MTNIEQHTTTHGAVSASSLSPFIIGIAGGSGSGKSTLAEQMRTALGEQRSVLINLDAYYRNQDEVPPTIRGNVDHPDALDHELLYEHLQQLKAGQSIQMPQYAFNTHTRLPHTLTLESKPFIILDGILLFALETVRAMLDWSIYVDAPADMRLARRLLRDIKERGRTPENVIEQYFATVRPMHEIYVEPFKGKSDFCVRNETHFEPSLFELIRRLN